MPKILGWRRPGKIGRRWLFIYSPIAQSVERVTVNHDVVGSSPTWGARKEQTSIWMSVFFGETAKAIIELASVHILTGCVRKPGESPTA